ncbi:hypothetical protein KC19_VG099800 [Ceratodon purpureus]|uniref:Secreted protein n=1 Tax=Ceratodon purpureus TaxID=3225 RepID=A0A8T0HNQ2_CERPU|nr:hypothetical protein KC19_VG099800 [Ceratodon purpureus]
MCFLQLLWSVLTLFSFSGRGRIRFSIATSQHESSTFRTALSLAEVWHALLKRNAACQVLFSPHRLIPTVNSSVPITFSYDACHCPGEYASTLIG